MNTNRSSAQASSATAGLDALLQQQAQNQGRQASSSDAAAFERWMAQYRPAESARPPESSRTGTSGTPAASAARGARAQGAEWTKPPTEPAAAARQDAPHAASQTPSQRPASKDMRKPNTGNARPADAANAKPTQGAQQASREAEDDLSDADAVADDTGHAVSFQTTHGEGSAWVRELPVPDDVATGDPAAMLAWLSSLHNPAQGAGAQVETAGVAEGSSAVWRSSDSTAPVGRHGGADALTLLALQRGAAASGQGSDTGADTGSDTGAKDGRGGLSLEGMALVKDGGLASDAAGAASFASALQRELSPAGTTRGEATPRHYTGNLHTPMDSPAFTQALTDRVAFWVNGPAADGPMTAELRLNPAEMGPVHIRIELDGQNAQIDFAAAAAETRQAIEASLGQLSAALEESGLKLSGGGVSDQSAQQQAWAQAAAGQSDAGGQPGRGRGQSQTSEGRWAQVGTADGVSESLGARAGRPGRAGGLDLYA